MIDRIEELLSEMAEEENEEEREDVPAQKRGAVVSSGLSSERNESGEAPEDRTAFAQSEGLGRVANRRGVTTEKREKAVSEGAWTGAGASDGAIGPREQPETEGKRASDLTALARDNIAAKPRVANSHGVTTEKRGEAGWEGAWTGARASGGLRSGPQTSPRRRESDRAPSPLRSVTTGEITSEQPELMTGELWRVGPVWTVRGGTTGSALEGAARSGPVQAGLEGLYRQTVQGLRPAAPALPPEQAGRTARAREPGSAASLAVDELDRAVRRDSRRYDGGMSIY